jgi:hypothetical protein
MDEWFVILFWSGPIGLGAFFAGLGVFFWGVSKSREADKKAKGGGQEGQSAEQN